MPVYNSCVSWSIIVTSLIRSIRYRVAVLPLRSTKIGVPFGRAKANIWGLGLSYGAETYKFRGEDSKGGEKSFALPVAVKAKNFSRQRPRFLAVRCKNLDGATVDRRITAEPFL